jgi:hypothetical protein
MEAEIRQWRRSDRLQSSRYSSSWLGGTSGIVTGG